MGLIDVDTAADPSFAAWEGMRAAATSGAEMVVHGLVGELNAGALAWMRAAPGPTRFAWHADRTALFSAIGATSGSDELAWFPCASARLSRRALAEARATFANDLHALIATVREIVFDGGERRALGPAGNAACSVIEGVLPLAALLFPTRAFAGPAPPELEDAPAGAFAVLRAMARPGRAIGLGDAHVMLGEPGQLDRFGAAPKLARSWLQRWRSRPGARREASAIIAGWAPSFALVEPEADRVALLAGPAAGAGETDVAGFLAELLDYTLPNRTGGQPPPYVIVARPGARTALRAARLEDWMLGEVQVGLINHSLVALALEPSAGTRLMVSTEERPGPADVLAIKSNTIAEVVVKGGLEWLATAAGPAPELAVRTLRIVSPLFPPPRATDGEALPALEPDTALTGLLRLCVRMRSALAAGHPPDIIAEGWRREAAAGVPDRLSLMLLDEPLRPLRGAVRALAGEGSLCDVVMGLPLFSFGGVERVALRVAHELRRQGKRTSVVVTAASSVESHREAAEAFDEIHLLRCGNDAPVNLWADPAALRRFVGIAGQADAFIPSHVADWPALSPALRAAGVPAVPYLHLHGRAYDHALLGHAHMTRDAMAAADGAIVISRRLAAWLGGSGFRLDRIHVAPNGPSHQFVASARSRSLEEKARRRPNAALRVVYVGRLDHEKGLERLADVALSADRTPELVSLRFVGAPVLGSAILPEAIDRRRMSPTFVAAELAAHFAWADALLMASHVEGVPLVILEAMAFGCVPVCTDVGAIAEVVRDGQNGLMVDAEAPDVAHELFDRLLWLQRHPDELSRLAHAAAASVPAEPWAGTAAGIAAFLDRLAAARPLEPTR